MSDLLTMLGIDKPKPLSPMLCTLEGVRPDWLPAPNPHNCRLVSDESKKRQKAEERQARYQRMKTELEVAHIQKMRDQRISSARARYKAALSGGEVKSKDVADRMNISPWSARNWLRRHEGILVKRNPANGCWIWSPAEGCEL